MKLGSRRPLILSFIASAALLVAANANFAPKFLWNASDSAPLGLYFVAEKPVKVGDFALVFPPYQVKEFIEKRGYLPSDTPLIKRVAAMPGAEICRDGARVSINKIVIAEALKADSMGRPMPEWSGCFVLESTQIFLLNSHEKSLDGRYFGATNIADVAGVAAPLWTYEKK